MGIRPGENAKHVSGKINDSPQKSRAEVAAATGRHADKRILHNLRPDVEPAAGFFGWRLC
ncbi:hypothetical protein AGR7B_Cc50266 [Agrobacterium deltaense RV3]|nr:hypothetical protein AGR7B_Cc50266 [Agrobacterium deltaense RV3]